MKKKSPHTNYFYEIYNSVLEVDPDEWYQLVDQDNDLAMNQSLIHLMESTISEAKFWTVVFRNQDRQIVACANLCLFQTDTVQSAPSPIKKCVELLRFIFPTVLKWNVLFCGLPIPSGHSHLRFSKGIESDPILNILNVIMKNLARQKKAKLIVFKEFNSEELLPLSPLNRLGFHCAELEPMFILPGLFKNFSNYLTCIRSSYRHQIRSSLKKFNLEQVKVEHIVDPIVIATRFTNQVHNLYLNVWQKAKEKLECLPLDFFQRLPQAMRSKVAFTLISSEQKPIGFSIGLIGNETYYNLYAGIDDSLRDKLDLYFNLFYHELDFAFQFQKEHIFLGQTSNAFKARLGATPSPRFFFVRALGIPIKLVLIVFKSLIFPKFPDQHAKNKVFK